MKISKFVFCFIFLSSLFFLASCSKEKRILNKDLRNIYGIWDLVIIKKAPVYNSSIPSGNYENFSIKFSKNKVASIYEGEILTENRHFELLNIGDKSHFYPVLQLISSKNQYSLFASEFYYDFTNDTIILTQTEGFDGDFYLLKKR